MCWRVQSEARDSDLPRNDPRRNLGVPVFEREARVKYLVTLECAVTRVRGEDTGMSLKYSRTRE